MDRVGICSVGLFVLMGCSTTDVPEVTFTSSDSAGVAIAVNGSATAVETLWRLAEQPRLTVGVVDGEPEYQLHEVMDATVVDDGIVVINGGSRSLRAYDLDGGFLAEIGRGGRGPGEFVYPMYVTHRPPDTLLVWDNPQFRLNYFLTDGTFLSSDPIGRDAISGLLEPPHFSEGVQVLPGGDLLVSVFEGGGAESFPAGMFRPESGWLIVSRDLTRVDTLGFYGGIEQMFVEAGGRSYPVMPPNFRSSEMGFGGSPLRVCIGDQTAFQVDCFEGGARQVVRWSGDAAAVTDAEYAEWEEETRGRWSQQGLADVADPLLARVPREGEWPPYGDVVVDEMGYLWVGGSSWTTRRLDPNPFLVFDREGRVVARIDLPPMRILEIGSDYVVGLGWDENGVEHISVYDLERT